MIVVRVRDQHGVDIPEAFHSRMVGSPQVRDAAPKQRVREELGPVELHEDGRVAEVCHGVHPGEYARAVEGTAERASRGRMVAAWILVVLALVVAVLALIAGYVRYQALDTPTVRNSAEEMIADPAIREQIAATLVDELYSNVDVQARLEEQLPEQQKALAGVVAGALRGLADNLAVKLLERPRVQSVWVDSVERAHESLVKVLDDDVTAVSTENGYVVLNLQPLVVQIGEEVAILGRVGQRLPEDTGRIRIMKADDLETAQDLTQLFKQVAAVIVFVPFILLAIAISLAKGRRRPVLRTAALGLIGVGLLVLIARKVGGTYVVDNLVETDSVRPAAQNSWNIFTELLADGAWTVIGMGVVALVGLWLSGPSKSATAGRRDLAPFAVRPDIAFGTVAVLYLLVLLWGPTAQTHRWPFVITAALLLALGVELLRRQILREHPDARGADLSESARALFGRPGGVSRGGPPRSGPPPSDV
jgi:hypothetical protein